MHLQVFQKSCSKSESDVPTTTAAQQASPSSLRANPNIRWHNAEGRFLRRRWKPRPWQTVPVAPYVRTIGLPGRAQSVFCFDRCALSRSLDPRSYREAPFHRARRQSFDVL